MIIMVITCCLFFMGFSAGCFITKKSWISLSDWSENYHGDMRNHTRPSYWIDYILTGFMYGVLFSVAPALAFLISKIK